MNPRPADSPEPALPALGEPVSFEEVLVGAIGLHQAGEIGTAEKVYLQLLEVAPDQPDVLHFLGVLRHQQGRSDEATELIRAALSHAPSYAAAWNNLGKVYRETERVTDACDAFRRAVAIDPENVEAWHNLGIILSAREEYTAALEAHRHAVELAPGFADAHYSYANTLRASGNDEEAIETYRKALALDPSHEKANARFGYVLYLAGRREEAIRIFRDWVELDPDNPVARHMLAACSGEGVPERASDDFVRQTFDGFADSFDEILLERLNYHAPDLVAGAIREIYGEPVGCLDVLDAGCGTGLCAPHVRPFARTLVGVDLSPRMLDKAAARGGYDQLREGELTRYLKENPDAFDLILSADTLVYFGALEPVLRAASASLRVGGWLVFTVESSEDRDGFTLGPHGRYGHGDRYLRAALDGAGFEGVGIAPAVLRREAGADVDGYLARARIPRPVRPGAG